MSSSTSGLGTQGVFGLDNDPGKGDVAPHAPEPVAADARSRREQQIRRTLDELNRQNARDQVVEGDFARSRLRGIYLGRVSSTLVSALTGAKTRRDWAEHAVRAYTNAISLDPSLAEAYVGRASVYRFLERYAEAKQDLERARELGVADVADDQTELEHRVRGRRIILAAAVAGVCLVCYFAVAYHGRSGRQSLPAQTASEPTQRGDTAPASPAAPKIAETPAVKAPATPAPARAQQPPFAPAPVIPSRAAAANAQAPESTCSGELPADGSCVPSRPAPNAAASRPTPPAENGAAQQPSEDTCPTCSPVRDAEALASIPQLAGVNRADAEMIALACRSSETAGSDAYQACIAAQAASLEEAIPMPDLSALPAIDQQLIRRVCTNAGLDGPAVYRRCIGSQLISLASAPDLPNLSSFAAERRRAIELACRSAAAGGAAAYHTCMDRQAKQARLGRPSVTLPKN